MKASASISIRGPLELCPSGLGAGGPRPSQDLPDLAREFPIWTWCLLGRGHRRAGTSGGAASASGASGGAPGASGSAAARAPRHAPAPRGSRDYQWGPWKVAQLVEWKDDVEVHIGWGATCACHSDGPADHTRCQKTLRFCGVSSDECEGRIREWLLAGDAMAMDQHEPGGRTAHKHVDPWDLTVRPRDVQDSLLPIARPLAPPAGKRRRRGV